MRYAMASVVQMPMWGQGGHVMGMHWGWWTLWIVVLVLLVWGLVRAFGGDGRYRRDVAATDVSAEETLRRRLAEGEIDEEEYERRLETLRGTRDTG